MPRRLWPLAGLLLALSLSCTSIKARVMARAAVDGLESLDRYGARVVERGLLRDAPGTHIVRSVHYQWPGSLRVEVLEPPAHAGELFVSDGSTVSIWWPRPRIGLRIRGGELPSRREIARTILESCYWLAARYDFSQDGTGRIAGRDVVCWRAEPDTDEPYVFAYETSLDAGYGFPVALSLHDAPGREWYGFEIESIDLDAPIPEGTFAFEFPEASTVFECDLASPALTLPQARDLVQFPVLEPARLPAGHAVRKIVAGGDPDHFPMVVLLVPKGARWLSLTQTPNLGPALVPEIGLPVEIGARKGILNFAFGFTIVSWSVEGTSLTLIGNLPYPEMLEVAGSVEPEIAGDDD